MGGLTLCPIFHPSAKQVRLPIIEQKLADYIGVNMPNVSILCYAPLRPFLSISECLVQGQPRQSFGGGGGGGGSYGGYEDR